MDEGSNGTILSAIRNLFRKSEDSPLEEMFKDAVAEGEIKSDDVRILQNVVDLEDRRVSEIMIPRPDIICAEQDSTLSEIAELIIQHGHSRIPIYRDNRDHMVGVVHAKDVLGPLLKPESGQPALAGIMRPVHFVPETTNLKSLLHDMQSRKIHLVVALDEYGGTAGMLTMEDVLEQIVGDIWDETDTVEPDIIEQAEGVWELDGDMSVSDFLELMSWDEDSFDFESETVGGWTIEMFEGFPQTGDQFEYANITVTVLETDGRRVSKVLVRQNPAPDVEE